MTTQTEALKLANSLNELLESFEKDGRFCKSSSIRNELYERLKQTLEESKEALAQPEQKPVAYGMWDTMIGCGGRMMCVRLDKGQDGCTVPLYTTQSHRKPLTELQVRKIASSLRSGFTWFEFAQAIEAASTTTTTTVNSSNHAGFEKLSGEFSTTVLEPEQEPVYQIKVYGSQTAWHDAGSSAYDLTSPNERRILYTTPPQRKPLTYVDLRRIASQCGLGANEVSAQAQAKVDNFARAIEAAHGIGVEK